MALSIADLTQDKEGDTKSNLLLNKYLQTACHFTYKSTILGAHKEAHDLAKSPRWQEIKMSDIEKKEKEVKKELSQFGMSEKLAYYANLPAGEHMKETALKVGAFCVAAIVGKEIDPALGQGVALAAATYFGSKMVAGTIGDPDKSGKKLFSNRDYADLKHASIALKKLKNHMIDEENKRMTQEAMAKGAYIPMYYSGRCM